MRTERARLALPLCLLFATLPAAFAAAIAAGTPGVACAQPANDPGAEADRLNTEGKKLAQAGQIEAARAKLEEAWSLKKAYDIAGNLALVEARLGAYDLALEHVEFALRTFPASGKAEHRKGLDAQVKELRPKVVLLVMMALPPTTVLTVNSRSLTAPIDGNVYTLPGKVSVRAEHKGDKPAVFEGSGVAGGTLTVPLLLEPLKPDLPPDKDPPDVTPPVPSPKPVWPIVLGTALSVTGVALGAGMLGGAAVKSSEADDLAASAACKPVTPACLSDGQSLADARGTFNTVGIVALSVGGATLIGTLIYALVPGPRASSPATPKSGAITFAPVFGPTFQGAVLSGAL